MLFARTLVVLALTISVAISLSGQVEELDLFASSGQEEIMDLGELEPWRQVIYETSCLSKFEKARAISLLEKLPFVDWHQLQADPQISPAAIRCMVGSYQDGRPLRFHRELDEKTRLSYVYRTKNGALDGYHLIRLRSALTSRIRMGMVLERDPGEKYWFRNGPPYWGGFLEWNKVTKGLDRLILGDYKVTLGQGLLFNNQFRKGLVHGMGQLPIIDHTRLLPFQGVDENRGLRGLAFEWKWDKLRGLIFASSRHQDASVSDDNGIRTLQYSGLHISESSVENRDRLCVSLVGLGLTYKSKRGQISVNQVFNHQDRDWTVSDEIRKRYQAKKKCFYGLSLSHRYQWKTVLLYGETAIQPGRSLAFSQGAILNAGSHQWSVMVRHLPKDFIAQYTQGMFRSAFRNNETGLFLGYVYQPSKVYELSINFDQTIQPWWSFNSGPGSSSDLLTVRISKVHRKRSNQNLRLSYRQDFTNNGHLIKSSRIRYHLSKIIHKGLEWRMRSEMGITDIKNALEFSWLHYQEVKWSIMESPWQGLLRITAYQSDSYEGRLYAYEHRLGGNFLIPPFYGLGLETYIMIKYRAGPLKVAARFSLRNRDIDGLERTTGTSASLEWVF